MALFSAYIDAAGNSKDQPFVIVTGYIANWVQWKLFENSWNEIHKDHDVALPFHMSDFVEAHLHPGELYASKESSPRLYRDGEDTTERDRIS